MKKSGGYVPSPRAPDLPWPRNAEDGTALGVDLAVAEPEVRSVVRRYFVAPPGVDMDDYCQEVCLRIAFRNRMPSAHDPRKSSLRSYIYMIANATGANMANSTRHHAVTLSLQGVAGAVGPTGARPDLEDVLASSTGDELPPDAEIDLGVLAVRGAIGPTARSYAMDCLAGRSTAGYGSPWRRSALRAEIADAVSGVGGVLEM